MTAVFLLVIQILQAAGVPISVEDDQLVVVGSSHRNFPATPPPPPSGPSQYITEDPIAISNGF